MPFQLYNFEMVREIQPHRPIFCQSFNYSVPNYSGLRVVAAGDRTSVLNPTFIFCTHSVSLQTGQVALY